MNLVKIGNEPVLHVIDSDTNFQNAAFGRDE